MPFRLDSPETIVYYIDIPERIVTKSPINKMSMGQSSVNIHAELHLVSFADREFHSSIASCKSFLNDGFCK